MFVVRCFAYIDYVNDCISHFSLIGHGIGGGQLSLYQIKGKEEFILLQQSIVLCFITALAFDVLCLKKRTPLMNDSFLCSIFI